MHFPSTIASHSAFQTRFGPNRRAPPAVSRRPDPLLAVQPQVSVGDDAGGLLERRLGILDQEPCPLSGSADLRLTRVEGHRPGRVRVGEALAPAVLPDGTVRLAGAGVVGVLEHQGQRLGELGDPVTAGLEIGGPRCGAYTRPHYSGYVRARDRAHASMLLITQDCSSIESRVMPRSLSSDTNDAMYLLFDISLVVLGAMIFWYRERLGRSMARLQQDQARTWPWLYPGRLGRWYTSERAWRRLLIPVLAIALILFGSVWLWKGAY
jgi:hypothetical protein